MRRTAAIRNFVLAFALHGCAWIDSADVGHFRDQDGDDVAGVVDCDDHDVTVTSELEWYLDADGDNHGDPTDIAYGCRHIDGRVALGDDCDDQDELVHPGVAERCDAADIDEDCDGLADDDDDDAKDLTTWYVDDDGDGFGLTTSPVLSCDGDGGYAAVDGDCDDEAPLTHPGGVEVCDPGDADEDCDGDADDLDFGATGKQNWYLDLDGDGHGGRDAEPWCDPPPNMVTSDDDCDDDDPTAFGDVEVWYDGVDGRCDGDDDFDQDADGFRAAAHGGDDCDDTAASVFVGAADAWYDGVDSDCAGDDDFDQDEDGATRVVDGGVDCDDTNAAIYAGAVEYKDGLDTDCDGKDWACGTTTFRVPADYSGIQAAIDAACVGDHVLVAPGSYVENLVITKAIRVRGPGVTLAPANPAASVVRMTRGALDGITITGGAAAIAGIDATLSSAVEWTDVTVTENTGSQVGGAYLSGGDATLTRVHFTDNAGGTVAGLDVWNAGGLRIVDSEFSGNQGTWGGARIYDADGTRISGTVFAANGNTGLSLTGSVDVVLSDCIFDDNTSTTSGAGLHVSYNTDLTLVDSTFSRNTADVYGGGIVGDRGEDYTLERLHFEDNVAVGGGATYLSSTTGVVRDIVGIGNGDGSAVTIYHSAGMDIERVDVSGGGGGVAFTSILAGAVRDVIVSDGAGRAFYVTSSPIVFEDVTLVANHPPATAMATVAWIDGGGARINGFSALDNGIGGVQLANASADGVLLSGNAGSGLIADQTAAVTHATIVHNDRGVYAPNGDPVLSHVLVAYNAVGTESFDSPTVASVQYGNVVPALYGNAARFSTIVPGFQTDGPRLPPPRRDLHLAPGSLLRDAGDATAQDADGTRADVGAYGGAGDWLAASAWYEDADNDTMFDGWEAARLLDGASDDRAGDRDGDGLTNLVEFQRGTWPALRDTDGDGIDDGTEVAAATDPLDPASR